MWCRIKMERKCFRKPPSMINFWKGVFKNGVYIIISSYKFFSERAGGSRSEIPHDGWCLFKTITLEKSLKKWRGRRLSLFQLDLLFSVHCSRSTQRLFVVLHSCLPSRYGHWHEGTHQSMHAPGAGSPHVFWQAVPHESHTVSPGHSQNTVMVHSEVSYLRNDCFSRVLFSFRFRIYL